MDFAEGRRIRPGPPRLEDFDYSRTDVAYFVTICADSGAPFADPVLASVVIEALTWLRAERGIHIYAYCLMPDHLHVLLQLPEDAGDSDTHVAEVSVPRRPSPLTLSSVMAMLKGFTSRQSWTIGYEGQLWQKNYYDHILRGYESGQRIAEYILGKPVRKGLVEQPENYPWSGMPDPL